MEGKLWFDHEPSKLSERVWEMKNVRVKKRGERDDDDVEHWWNEYSITIVEEAIHSCQKIRVMGYPCVGIGSNN